MPLSSLLCLETLVPGELLSLFQNPQTGGRLSRTLLGGKRVICRGKVLLIYAIFSETHSIREPSLLIQLLMYLSFKMNHANDSSARFD